MNVTNVKQTPGRWEQLQTVDGMLLHGCSQECASLPFVLRTNWGEGGGCSSLPDPRVKGYFSSCKQQSNSVRPDLDAKQSERLEPPLQQKTRVVVGGANRTRRGDVRENIRCLADQFKSF